MSGIKTILIGLILTGMFGLALINGGIQLGINHNSANNIGDDPSLSSYKSSLESSLEDAHTNANASVESLGESPISALPGGFIFDAAARVWKTLKAAPVSIYNSTIGIADEKIFGPAFYLILGGIGAIILILIALGVIKLVISGQDE